MSGTLNARQKKFAELYAASGNATQAAIGAGYSVKTAPTNSDKLLKNTKVRAYLEELTKSAESSRIATITELREFWTATLREGDNDYKDRLKASELLGKSMGAFLERREHSGGLQIEVVYGDE